MTANKNFIASLLLVLFGIIQIADLHALDHDADDLDCKICQFASDQKSESFLPIQQIQVPQTLYVNISVISLLYPDVLYTENEFGTFHNKAPPAA
ncbi:hypothetical protein ACE939_13665 [Aquimarina sp. W85]|uniref:hypothetical protein n=1 Tax=Aquimarina rhodophyticola TaxID=3342246 RepID=UPI0036708FCA